MNKDPIDCNHNDVPWSLDSGRLSIVVDWIRRDKVGGWRCVGRARRHSRGLGWRHGRTCSIFRFLEERKNRRLWRSLFLLLLLIRTGIALVILGALSLASGRIAGDFVLRDTKRRVWCVHCSWSCSSSKSRISFRYPAMLVCLLKEEKSSILCSIVAKQQKHDSKPFDKLARTPDPSIIHHSSSQKRARKGV